MGGSSPWGTIQHATKLSDGVIAVSTAGHGGIFVNRGHPLSKTARTFADKWSHGWGPEWFEEDCAAAYVAAEMPHLFTDEQVETAKEMIERF